MTIGIMGAIPEEVDIIRQQIIDISEVQHGSRIYYRGKINDVDVVLVFSRCGKVAASATATSLITEFKIDQLIFTGVAGATSPQLNIGDIVVSRELYQHDMDPRPLFPRYEIPLTGVTFFKADATLIKKAFDASEDLLDHIEKKIPAEILSKFKIVSPKCLIGTITSGDEFISDIERTKAIVSEKPQTIAVEMEGAAIAQVCHDYGIPFVVIRTISDRADHHAAVDFPLFIEEIAKRYAEHIVRHMFASMRTQK